jgi:hypothetical protein
MVTYADCLPLLTPGSYTAASALEAAQAWDPTGTAQSPPFCAIGCLGWQTASSCAVWCYTGSTLEGQVGLNTISATCLCPSYGALTTSTWN